MRNAREWMAVAALLCLAGSGRAEDTPAKTPKPKIQIALLLDTSGSMNGLINQAKSQLWGIVNGFVTAKRDGVRPEFEVALYEYGNDRLAAKDGWIREVLPLTNNLDQVSEQLFALTTDGGNEYCGQVIQRAVEGLAWSANAKDLKAIFIAGNEPFTQGAVDYRASCKAAIEKGITVSTIFCGNAEQGISTGWKDGSVLADGSYANIDQNRVVVQIMAPQDADLTRLNTALNETYIAFGKHGAQGRRNQIAQDNNAVSSGLSSAMHRGVTKSSALYCNSSWDMVDACAFDKLKVEDVKEEDLPENMKKMTVEERKKYVDDMAQGRKGIQEEIKQLSAERAKFVAEEERKQAEKNGTTLEHSISNSAVEQARKLGYTFK